ncbi:MAG: HIT family protein [Candidatus Woesearchaeota archaeon]
MTTNCLFCNIKEDYIFENEHFFAIFDIHPISPGHSLVIPKKHIISLLDLETKQWNNLHEAIKETIKIIENSNFQEIYQKIIINKPKEKSRFFCKKMLSHIGINKKPDGYNIGNNEGEVAGRTIHHLHIQIIPRYKNDVENPVGGIRNIIPGLGDYKNNIFLN